MSYSHFVSLSKSLMTVGIFWLVLCSQASGTELKPPTDQAFANM
jgi:hypothetical protein